MTLKKIFNIQYLLIVCAAIVGCQSVGRKDIAGDWKAYYFSGRLDPVQYENNVYLRIWDSSGIKWFDRYTTTNGISESSGIKQLEWNADEKAYFPMQGQLKSGKVWVEKDTLLFENDLGVEKFIK